MMQPFTSEHVQTALAEHGLDVQIHHFETTTATSQQAADNIGCQLGQIVKSIAFLVDGHPILVLTSGDQRVDDKKIAGLYNVGRKKVKVATPEQMVDIYGYAPGCMPPLAHRTPDIHVYIDESLGRFDMLYAAGGAHNAIFPLTLEQLLQVSHGKLSDVVRSSDTSDEA
ncbi:MAG: YbaK/EbsC family protein [Anaerolineae bacterium]|nr:YbaK/EbsC family protein [Anaerolineae bacterium]